MLAFAMHDPPIMPAKKFSGEGKCKAIAVQISESPNIASVTAKPPIGILILLSFCRVAAIDVLLDFFTELHELRWIAMVNLGRLPCFSVAPFCVTDLL